MSSSQTSAADAPSRAALEFWLGMSLPAYIIDRDMDIYMANRSLAATFGYQGVQAAEEALKSGDFLPAHFSSATVNEFYELLTTNGRVDDWLMRGEALDGRAVTLEITAEGRLRGSRGPQLSVQAIFVAPGEIRDGGAFLKKARLEAEQAEKAKNEFLANISHELKTPLNIVIGMLSLAVEDETVGEEMRTNLALAKDGADRLFVILNDLIVLSNLEGGRLASDVIAFSPEMLLMNLARQFAAKAQAKGITLRTETGDQGGLVLEGGYNFIVMAMEKLLHNAIKFVDDGQGEAVLEAAVESRTDGHWLTCSVADNGPGLAKDILESQELFRQGDGSMIRKHGGLGLGLRLTKNLAAALGGRLTLANRPEGGAKFSFSVPVKAVAES